MFGNKEIRLNKSELRKTKYFHYNRYVENIENV